MTPNHGSERRFLHYHRTRRSDLDASILEALRESSVSSIEWIYPDETTRKEPQGLAFVEGEALQNRWKTIWPTRGRQQSWDGVALLHAPGRDAEWLLIEAKGNHPEFCSPPTGAKGDGRKKIEKALNRTKTALGVHRDFPWFGTYYQHANRLVVLSFLNKNGQPARLLELLFVGEQFPDRRPCPHSESDWRKLLEARRLTLGLPEHHSLTSRIHEVFLPVSLG